MSKPKRKTNLGKKFPRRAKHDHAESVRILATALQQNMTALEVQERFKIKPVTFYAWRRRYMKEAQQLMANQHSSTTNTRIPKYTTTDQSIEMSSGLAGKIINGHQRELLDRFREEFRKAIFKIGLEEIETQIKSIQEVK